MNIKIMLSIIIPLYNSSEDIRPLIDHLLPLDVSGEILLINDGSTDDTSAICKELAYTHPEIKFIEKPHSGVSDTRNIGLKTANGKYILFLDSDDRIEKGSIGTLISFAEQCGEEVDLVTYPIETYYKGKLLPPHFRYKTLRKSGIYDLNIFPYIGQTTMNIMVRNRFENNVLFDPLMNFSEDQKYCCDVLKAKLKMGFCADAKYIYYRSETSSSGRISGACYIFEQSMRMFESLFSEYETVPSAFQGLYINDLAWKLRSNILYPYEYDPGSFEFAMSRIMALLVKVEPDVIISHPDIDFFHKFYWLSLKANANIKPFFHKDKFGTELNGQQIICLEKKCEIVVVRIRIDNNRLIFRGFLKSTVFAFYEMPHLFAIINGRAEKQRLFLSAHSYYLCHTQTNVFYGFCTELPVDDFETLSFRVEMGGYEYNCTYYFMPKSPFSHFLNRCDSVVGGRHLHYNSNKGEFSFGKKSCAEVIRTNSVRLPLCIAAIRNRVARLRKHKIHLYYDCRGVEKDNGYYRFIRDCEKQDGIERKYVCDPANKCLHHLFTAKQLKNVIPFGSECHKVYFLAAEKIFTAYIEDINLFPFDPDEYDIYSDLFGFEIVYLQHGVLHGSLPWKYTPEVITADKICVSTVYEQQLFYKKYHFRKEDIIPELMPRLRLIDRNAVPQKKILFAPSWRQYLIGPDINGVWQPEPDIFMQSDYYLKICELLNSKELNDLLERYDYTLDFKLHPIFSAYTELFNLDSDRVKIVIEADKTEHYRIFITDFSSFAFDFMYAGRRVFSFIPDKMQFMCGMNSYREIEPESFALFEKLEGMDDLYKLFQEPDKTNQSIFFEY